MVEGVTSKSGRYVHISDELVGKLARAIWQVQFHREHPDATPDQRNREWNSVRDHHIRYTIDALRMIGKQGIYITEE